MSAYRKLEEVRGFTFPPALLQAIHSGQLKGTYTYLDEEDLYLWDEVYSDDLGADHNVYTINLDFWARFMSSNLVCFAQDEGGYPALYNLDDGAIDVFVMDDWDAEPLKKLADTADDFIAQLRTDGPRF